MRAVRPAGLPSGGCIIPLQPRTAGAVDDVVTAQFTAADAEQGRIASIARALEGLDEPRAAGDVGEQRTAGDPETLARIERERIARERAERARRAVTNDSEAAQVFDPRDPASMTEARWRTMDAETQRAWIAASAASEDQKRRMVESIATGLFGTIREFITSERTRAVTQIEEAARTARDNFREGQQTRRLEIQEETRRLEILAQRARDEAAAANREAQNAQNETTRLRAQAEADAAREREQRTRADADAAAARLAQANADAQREARETRELERASARPADFLSTTAGKILAGLLGAAAVGTVGYVVVKAIAPPPPPPPPQLPPGYAYGAPVGR